MTAVVEAPPVRRPRRTQRALLPRLSRLLLAVAWLGLVLGAVLSGERETSFGDLQRDVAAGDVETVRITDGTGLDARGRRTLEVHWRAGPVGHTTEILVRRLDRRELEERLTALDPAVDIVEVEPVTWSNEAYGWRLTSSVGNLLAGCWIATLLVLLGSPQPWRATRWGWFWWLVLLPPVGIPAYLLLSGPTPPLPEPRDLARRAHGGAALCLVLAVSLVLTLAFGVAL